MIEATYFRASSVCCRQPGSFRAGWCDRREEASLQPRREAIALWPASAVVLV